MVVPAPAQHCVPSDGSPLCPLGRAGAQAPWSPPALQTAGWLYTWPRSASHFQPAAPSSSEPRHGQQETWNEGLDWTGLLQSPGLMLGGTCFSGGPGLLPAVSECKAVSEGRRRGVSLTWPFPGLWVGKRGKERGEEQQQLESQGARTILSGAERLREAAAQIHNVLPNPSPLIQLSAGQTSQIFLCV